MGSNKKQTLLTESSPPFALAGLFVALTFFTRLLWINDMEFKGDEKELTQIISGVGDVLYSPLAPVSAHSGIPHSSGFHYFAHFISFGSADPLVLGSAIALFNALSIAIPLWFLRKNRKAFLAFSMCAASMTLIMGSRKIWNPDLVAAWDCFALGFFAMAMQPRADRIQKVLMATSGFSLVMAGHMYLPGGVFALIVTGVASLWLFIYERRSIFYSWLTGCALGWLTFLPYFIAFLNTPHTPHLAQAYTLGQLWPVLRMDALLPSPFGTYELYLKPIHQWMHANAPGLNYYLTLGWTILAMLVWVPLYWISLIRGARNWRSLLKEPLAVCSAAVLLGIPIALYAVRLGSFLHYWLGAFPFAYYFIAWAVCLQPESRNSMKLYRVAWAACLISLVASLQIALLIHQMGGLPGEYGPSYSSQTPQQRLR